MKKMSKLDLAWIVLMLVTLLNTLVAESAQQSHFISAVICFSIAFKGRLVIDYFMELNEANDTIRQLVRSYFYFFPLLILLCDVFSEQLRIITSI